MTTAAKTAGSEAWSSVTEQSILLDDGLKFVVEVLLPPPVSSQHSAFVDCISEHKFETSSNAELSKTLLSTCALQHGSYYKFFEYRQRALLGLWQSQRTEIKKLATKLFRYPSEVDRGKATSDKLKGQVQGPEVSFSSHVSLLLLLPILQSQSRTDPSLAGQCTELLLHCLQNCAPNSLAVEPTSCIKGLADLLCSWLRQMEDSTGNICGQEEISVLEVKKESLVAALIALACGRLSIQLFVQVLQVLQKKKDVLGKLPVGSIVRKVLEYERMGTFGDPSVLQTSRFISSWQFESAVADLSNSGSSDEIYSLACDGKFLYLKNSAGKGLVKVGTGKQGTLRGAVYRRNPDLGEGWLVFVQGWLMFRPKEFDSEPTKMCYVLDPLTLQITRTVQLKSAVLKSEGESTQLPNYKTIQFLSDSVHLYWLWSTKASPTSQDSSSPFQTKTQVDLFLQEFTLEMSDGELESVASPCNEPVVVRKKEDPPAMVISPIPLRRSPTATVAQKDTDEMSSCGLLLGTLLQAAMFVDGDMLVMVVQQQPNPANSTLLSLRGHRSPLNYCFSTLDGSCIKQENVINTAMSNWQDLLVTGLSVCQDAVNGRLWMYGNNHISEWISGGYPSYNQVLQKLQTTSTFYREEGLTNDLDPQDAMSSLAYHITFLCKALDVELEVLSTETGDVKLHGSVDPRHIGIICDILGTSVSEDQRYITIAMLVALQTLMKLVQAGHAELENTAIETTKLLLWKLVSSQSGHEVEQEACGVIRAGFDVLYPTVRERSALMMHLLSEGGSCPGKALLLALLLTDLADDVMRRAPGESPIKERVAEDVVYMTLKVCIKESCDTILQCGSLDDESFHLLVVRHPELSPALQYITAVFIANWREIVICDEVTNAKQVECQMLSLKILEGCQQIFDVCLEVLNKLSAEYKGDCKSRMEGLEHVLKATLPGQTLPLLASVLSCDKCGRLSMAKNLLPAVTNTTVTATRVAFFLSELKFRGESTEGAPTATPDLSSVPLPWSSPRSVETPHPVRDDYQCCRTVVLPGAECLYLRFDPRCATQYEYDKVIVYAGKGVNGRKVAEFGGNSYGAGGRGVVRLGWPKEPVKVTGESVTFSFQVKSARERSTPEKAMWGFSCIVSSKENEDKEAKLPFLTDLCLGLSLLTHSLLNIRYQGPAHTEAEDACRHLLDSKLLQRCVWPTMTPASNTCGIAITVSTEGEPGEAPASIPEQPVIKPSSRLSPELLKSLRNASGIAAPTIRPSLRQALQTEAVEEVVLRCVIKHMGLSSAVHRLELVQAAEVESEEYTYLCEVMKEVFSRVDGLIRRLQTMAEMEQKWAHELDDVREGLLQPSAAFFNEFHLQEAKSKELELLCALKNVEFDPMEQEQAVGKLIERLEKDARAEKETEGTGNALNLMPVTKKFLFSVMECAELLCNVTIESSKTKPAPERSISHSCFAPDSPQALRVTANNQLRTPPSSPTFNRSLSAPSKLDRSMSVQEGIHDVRRLQRWRTNVQKKHSRASSEHVTFSEVDKSFTSTVAEIFSFIGSDPDKAVTCSSFLAAARVRNERGLDRVQALQCMIELVTVCSRVGTHVPHLLSAVASILAQGPRTEELKCGGMVREVRDMFSGVTQAVVQQASFEPAVYRDSVLVLSTCPFSWHEERCVMRSGLVSLLDKLCTLRSEKSEAAVNLSAMAWAGFQVLLDRVVQWENDKDFRAGAIEWSGLAHQVSSLLSNYLTCVLEESRKDGSTARDALQFIMELLHSISRSKLGEGILREPRTVSTLLSLLLDRRAPPKLVLIVLKLCRCALPLMSAKSCEEVTLPPAARHYIAGKHGTSRDSTPRDGSSRDGSSRDGTPVVRVAKLLLAKLGDFVLPSVDSEKEEALDDDGGKEREEDISENSDVMCLYLHKRDDQPAHEVVQKVLSTNGASFIFRVGQGSEMERAVQLDRELTQYGRGVLQTDSLAACLTKAAYWAQKGLVVSLGPVGRLDEEGEVREALQGQGDPESVCKARNSRLTRSECSRPFISGQVANTMASEVISLLHGLLASSATETTKLWASAVRDVLCEALDYVPDLIHTLEGEGRVRQGEEGATGQESAEEGMMSNEHEWFFKARNVVAALCALGGFRQNFHSGCMVQVCGEDIVHTTGEVVSVSERQGVATVLLDTGGVIYNDIPLARLRVANTQAAFLSDLSIAEQAVTALLSILTTKEAPVSQTSFMEGEHTIVPSPAARILAEIKTRASMVLSFQVMDASFSETLLTHPSHKLVSTLAAECDPGQRLPVVESHCRQLRKLFKDFVKPDETPSKGPTNNKRIVLDSGRTYPPVRGCVFTEGHTCVHFMADPGSGLAGLPRGTFVYASAPLPQKAPSFYWEVELCSLGDSADQETGPSISVGLAPPANQLLSGWLNPVGSSLLHSNGRAVHYRTGGLLQWKTVSLNVIMKEGDVIGCGFKRTDEVSDKGLIYFTYNGDRLAENLEGIKSGLWPVIHIQKKNVRVRVNFGARGFVYAEGLKHRAAADMWSDSMEELRQGFDELPFAFDADQETVDGQVVSKPAKTSLVKPVPISIPKPAGREYDPLSCLQYKLTSSYDNMTDVGPAAPLGVVEEGSSKGGEVRPMDPSRLLVKAWEDKVFPVIRRRFRSNSDRQSGLEQIRGALLAGMIDIAVSTVADLYEDNGGIPSTLQFPKLDDVKEDANKFNAGSLRPGQAVVIDSSGASLPGFAVPDMKKTFGWTGVVKAVDKPQGLAEVETYNREEGTLLRYWYPISTLKRPSAVLARSSSLALCSEDTTRAEIYCELLRNEACLSRMFCREANVNLLERQAACGSQTTDIAGLLQTLATQLLAKPQNDGTITMKSPQSAPDPRHCLVANSLLPSALFFSEPSRLVSEVRKLLSVAVEQDEEEVLRVVNSLCESLKDVPVGNHRECSVSSGKPDEHVIFSGAAVTVVSCREDPGCLSSGIGPNPRAPCVSILCYHGHQKLNRSGQQAQYRVVQYPNTGGNGDKTDLYPDMILPCNRLHVRYQSSATEGLIVDLNAFPAEFFLSLVFIEVFASTYLEDVSECSEASDSDEGAAKRTAVIHRTIAFELIDILSSFLLKHHLPVVIKEVIFHLLAQLLRACHQAETSAGKPQPPDLLSTFDLFISRLAPLRVELQKLIEKELSANNTAALDFILNCNFEHSKFSSYLQALLGLVSAAAEISLGREPKDLGNLRRLQRRISLTDLQNALQAAVPFDVTDSEVRSAPPVSMDDIFNFDVEAIIPPSSTETSTSSGPPSPKCMARDRRGSVRRRKRGYGHGVTSPTESMPWFDRIVSCTLLLRSLLHGDPRGSAQVAESLSAVVSTSSSSLQRLLIVTNISTTLSKKTALDAIKKACKPSGGIHEGTVYLPEVSSHVLAEEPSLPKETSEEETRVKSLTDLLPSAQLVKPERIRGYAVVELKSASQVELARQALAASKALRDDSSLDAVGVAKVNSELLMEGTNELAAFAVFDEFLNLKLFNGEATEALREIFSSCTRCVAVVEAESNPSSTEADSVDKSDNSTGTKESSIDSPVHGTEKNESQSRVTVMEAVVGPQSRESRVQDVKSLVGQNKSSETTGDAVVAPSVQLLTKDQICRVVPGNLLLCFLNAVRHAKESASELVAQLLRDHGNPVEERDEKGLGVEGFIAWVLARGLGDVRAIWKGIIACGYDVQLNRCTHILPSEMELDHAEWSVTRDHALVLYVDSLCRALSTTPSRLMPDELLLSEVDLTSENFYQLQGLSLRSLRSRFAFLKSLNSDVERLLLPLTDLRTADSFSLSTAALLREARGLLFYHTKVALLNQVLDHTAHRAPEHSPPEVSLDPLETLEADKVSSAGPQFCQAARHLSTLSSSGLRVKVATGGDPVFPLKVHLRGEQVLGSGGSFRHFMWLMARELQGAHVGLLIPCPSSAANKNKGKFILKPGPMTYTEEKLLIFFGQLLGIALRSDIPLALDILPSFWKSLLNLPLDDQDDLRETDILTYNYLRRFTEVENREEFQTLCYEANLCPYRFVYTSLDGEEVELCQDGSNVAVTWENHRLYVQAVRDLRIRELRCESRMAAVRCGLSSVVPLHVLTVMTPSDMEIRTCGLPSLDLGFLKAHTAYVAGIKETDVHIEYFWNSMESFTQDQLRKFVKFACNQERLPSRCTCQDGNPNTADVHVPPYPMKIGPPDGRGPSDARYIRVETCMFMVKLPLYSSQDIMTKKLLYAINCREDPLTDIT